MVTAFTVFAAFAVPESFASEFAQRGESDLYNRDDLAARLSRPRVANPAKAAVA